MNECSKLSYLRIIVVPPDLLQLQLLHGGPQHDVEELHVVGVRRLHLVHKLDIDGYNHPIGFPLNEKG